LLKQFVMNLDTGFQVKFHYDFQAQLSSMVSNVKSIADSIIGLALLISLIVVVNHLAHDAKYGKGKQAVISWMTAFAIWVVLRNLF